MIYIATEEHLYKIRDGIILACSYKDLNFKYIYRNLKTDPIQGKYIRAKTDDIAIKEFIAYLAKTEKIKIKNLEHDIIFANKMKKLFLEYQDKMKVLYAEFFV